MRKYQRKRWTFLLIALTVASVLFFTFPHGAAASTGSLSDCPTLSQGMSGQCVRLLQQELNQAGANPALAEDGDFGPLTKAAVVAFQTSHGLVGDGYVGPLTKAALSAAIKNNQCHYPVISVYPGGTLHARYAEVDFHFTICGNDPSTYTVTATEHDNTTAGILGFSFTANATMNDVFNGTAMFDGEVDGQYCVQPFGWPCSSGQAHVFLWANPDGTAGHNSVTDDDYSGVRLFNVYDTP